MTQMKPRFSQLLACSPKIGETDIAQMRGILDAQKSRESIFPKIRSANPSIKMLCRNIEEIKYSKKWHSYLKFKDLTLGDKLRQNVVLSVTNLGYRVPKFGEVVFIKMDPNELKLTENLLKEIWPD